MTIQLFQPFQLGALALPNRIVISPMCQYSADNGVANAWHAMHLGSLAASGAGLLTVEATAVNPQGRITPRDLGLYSDASEQALAGMIADLRQWSDIPVAVQLAHAGRKAACDVPWNGGAQLGQDAGGWPTVAPSALSCRPEDAPPQALDLDGIGALIADFSAAACRAVRAGANALQVHAGHGYLLHQFLSPLSNVRQDSYGGSLENRMRLTLEVTEAVQRAVGHAIPVTVRVSASDWVDGGWDIDQTLVLARALELAGCAGIDVSSGGLDPRQQIAVYPGYQVPFARAVKQAVAMPVFTVGCINEFTHAEAILAGGEADLVGLGRGILYNPHWPWHAAAFFDCQVHVPAQYQRGKPLYSPRMFAI